MSRRRKSALAKNPKGISTKWAGIVLVLALVFILFGALFVSQDSLASTNQYRSVARRSLEKLCVNYSCPQNHVEDALKLIVFADQSKYESESSKGSLSVDQNGEQSLAFTTKSEPRKIYVNIKKARDLAREGIPLEDALEEILDHEVVHQSAVSQILTPTLTITFNNRSFVAVSTAGLSLMNLEGKLENNRSNEAYTQWLAMLQMRTHKIHYGVPLYDEGPQIVDWLNARVGLDRQTVFDLYVHEGLPGFEPYFARVAGQPLIQIYGAHSGLSILVYLDRVLVEVNQNQYAPQEAIRRLGAFIETGYAPPQK